jgi:hypothetical protein
LLRWIKTIFDDDLDIYPDKSPVRERDLVAAVFGIAMRLYQEDKTWEETEPYLEDLHVILTAQDP